MRNTDLEFFMNKLRWLIDDNSNNNPLIKARKPMIQLLYAELDYLIGSCFKDLEDVGNWKTRLIKAAQKAEDTVDMFVSSAITEHDDLHPYGPVRHNLLFKDLKGVILDLNSIRVEMISERKRINFFQNLVQQDMMMDNKFKVTRTSGNRRVNLSTAEREEFIVGFEDDALIILDRLTGDRKKLDIISIVGMGGQGKTTLATKIFNDSLVSYHFDKRGWVTVSQAYSKRDLLLQLLTSIGKSVDESVSDSKMCEMLYQSLKRMKYLIVVDDIWSCKAWDDVRLCFPDDNNGSRVLVTTRLNEVALHASQRGFTHSLPHLTEDQSWELLCKKTFRGSMCPESLIGIGKHIAKKCGGLPLALVVMAGVLEKGEKRKGLWEKIAKSVGSYVINDPKGCMDTLALSYDHLPYHLKKCFLYVGGFPEDYKVQVRGLIRLWMAEGFIEETGQRSLEEEGECYLMDLIDRNLLIVAGKSSKGGVKSCRMHDLLREICLRKAFEESFFKKMSMQTSIINLDSNSVSSIVKQRRLFTDYEVLFKMNSLDFSRHTRSILCFRNGRPSYNVTSSWVPSFLLLKVLDLQHIPIFDFSNISMLLHLRYLAVWSDNHELSLSKASLWSLQTLIVKGMLPGFIYDNMVNLRHLRYDIINIPIDFSITTLFNLQSISRLRLDHRAQFLLESVPNIRKLGCCISSTLSNHGLLSFSMLAHLEALNIHKYAHESVTFPNPIRFPATLRKLTLSGLCLPWSHMSTIQQLPKLEVLKLLKSSFVGHMWDTGDEQFHRLKYLKLEKLNIRVWEASSINFPRLRKLVVRSCKDLSEIPLQLGYISTLEHIEISYSNSRVRNSAYIIQKAQREMENDDFHVSFTHMDPISRVFFEGGPVSFTHMDPTPRGVFFEGNPFYG